MTKRQKILGRKDETRLGLQCPQRLDRIRGWRQHGYRYESRVVASLLVESGSPNYVFVALLRCDTQDMVVEKVESIQRELFAIADITKTWKQNPFLPEKIREIRQAIGLPP